MNLPLVLRPAALVDVREIREYYNDARLGLGDEFADLLEKMLERIEGMPKLFPIVWRGVRAIRLARFPYVVYYAIREDRIDVLAVVHGSRDPASWRRRLQG